MDELIRDRMHEALEVEPPPFGLRARVIGSIPMDERSAQPPRRRSFQWVGQWAPSLVAILLAVAIIASFLYLRGAVKEAGDYRYRKKNRHKTRCWSPQTAPYSFRTT